MPRVRLAPALPPQLDTHFEDNPGRRDVSVQIHFLIQFCGPRTQVVRP